MRSELPAVVRCVCFVPQVGELIAGSEDVSSLTFKMMKTQLEEHFGVPLGDRKAELIDMVSDAM